MDYKDKIKKLLQLSKSPNENEALAALEMAHELLKKYNLSECDINLNDQSEIVENVYNDEDLKDWPVWAQKLITIISRVNYCEAVISTNKITGDSKIILFGRKDNISITIDMYKYVRTTMFRIYDKSYSFFGFSDKYSFMCGMSIRICERLESIIQTERETDCKDLVFTTEAHSEAFKKLKNIKIKSVDEQDKHNLNDLALSMGYSAGDEISLNKQVGKNDNR